MIIAEFAGDSKTEVKLGDFKVKTDLPEQLGGTNTAPTPFQLFLASYLSCTATTVLFFLNKRNMKKDSITLTLTPEYDEKQNIKSTIIAINVPNDFPEKEEAAMIAFAKHCKVGSHLNFPHEVIIRR